MRAKRLLVLIVIAAVLSLTWTSTQLTAHGISPIQETSTIPMLPGLTRPLAVGPGNQVNPHVACGVASYTNDDLEGDSSIKYVDFTTNLELFLPGTRMDRLSDTDGNQIAYTVLGPSGDQIFIYDLRTQIISGVLGLKNFDPSVASNFVAFTHGNPGAPSDVAVFDESTLTTTQLTNDGLMNKRASLSPDANVVVWEKCQVNGLACDVYAATKTGPGAYTTRRVSEAGVDAFADTNGQLIAYISNKGGENDIYIQRVDGTNEMHLALPGDQRDVRISGHLLVFETKSVSSYDVFLYDLSSARLYQVTNTPQDESLSDLITGCDGVDRIVYITTGTFGDWDVWETEFKLSDSVSDQLNDLIELVQSFNLHDGIENSLISKLQDALNAVNSGNTATACDSLTAFTNASQAQSGKKLTPSQSTQLIDAATQIKTDLGCH